MKFQSPIRRIAIVGAGPGGTACAKFLLAEKVFEKIDVFEQRDRVGGVWNLSSTHRSQNIPIPQEDPWYGTRYSASKSTTNGHHADGDQPGDTYQDPLEFESPLYDLLEANIPKQMMQYSDTPFPDHYPLYASHQETLEYLDRYAEQVKHLIRFNTQVQQVRLVHEASNPDQNTWELTSKHLTEGGISKNVYDAIVVANGHYNIPHIQEINGLVEWNKAYPGAVMHSKAYRRPEVFAGKRVVVIGNAASGSDIAVQIGAHSSHLYLSSRTKSYILDLSTSQWMEEIDEIVEFLPTQDYNRAVLTKNGIIVRDIDTVIFASGYLYSYPFLAELDPPIITDGLRTRDVYQHFLHIEYPTLALPIINRKILPFPVVENQAAVIARLWSGRLSIPSREEMRQWESETLQAKGSGRYFHFQKLSEEAVQVNDLYKWALSATPRSGLENNGVGKLGEPWDEYKVWLRSQFAGIKAAYIGKGEERRKIRAAEELGFDYEAWRKDAKPEDLEMFRIAKCPS